MKIIRYNKHSGRLWVLDQRIHHGPLGFILAGVTALNGRIPREERLVLGTIFSLWGITDLHDWKHWFRPGSQLDV